MSFQRGAVLFQPFQQRVEHSADLARFRRTRDGGARAGFAGLDSPQGHDAFLVDFERFGPPLRRFMQSLD